ncbi:hypothetical protein L210DRAFT_3400158 [Boletus edulis BED1]|uniref:MYND-type domain-containing protein n=1 Tax=Boletus edulis BED1 TaxID=1328754 RepID=A0AAD4GES5_BOLED|nr:hypothetical protein L210DRAFT_3400158 [Boletus edulis BED1]
MAKTCHKCHGYSDNYDEAKLKRCSGCQKVYYCSTSCQKRDWVCHIFDCKPRRPINTADYLALAVYQNLLPEHPQTCEDYGFNRAPTGEEKSRLLGLYIGLIKYGGISPKTIHDWRVRGVLVDEIKASFFELPEYSRGAYFPWFLENEHIVALAGQPLPEKVLHDRNDAMVVYAWTFTGGSERDSVETIRAAIERMSAEEQKCHALYALLLSKWHPSPYLTLWIDFGFASCTSQEEEMALGSAYRRLINLCTFKEFCDAYRGDRLLDLFRSKGVQVDDSRGHLQDLLHPGWRKSVWDLKQSIAQEDSSKVESDMALSVTVDYGFMNCRNDSERRQLKRVYKAFFDNDGDPVALHEAAIKGNLHGHLSKVVKGLKDPKFKRLMKNPYPLPDL